MSNHTITSRSLRNVSFTAAEAEARMQATHECAQVWLPSMSFAILSYPRYPFPLISPSFERLTCIKATSGQAVHHFHLNVPSAVM
jgi:hypothetical protein